MSSSGLSIHQLTRHDQALMKALFTRAVVGGSAVLLTVGYWAGQRTEANRASRYLFDVTSHMALSCANEHIVALTDFRAGRTDDAIGGLELLVSAKLANVDAARIAETTVAKKSFGQLKEPLKVYQAKFKSPVLDPKANAGVRGLLGVAQ